MIAPKARPNRKVGCPALPGLRGHSFDKLLEGKKWMAASRRGTTLLVYAPPGIRTAKRRCRRVVLGGSLRSRCRSMTHSAGDSHSCRMRACRDRRAFLKAQGQPAALNWRQTMVDGGCLPSAASRTPSAKQLHKSRDCHVGRITPRARAASRENGNAAISLGHRRESRLAVRRVRERIAKKQRSKGRGHSVDGGFPPQWPGVLPAAASKAGNGSLPLSSGGRQWHEAQA